MDLNDRFKTCLESISKGHNIKLMKWRSFNSDFEFIRITRTEKNDIFNQMFRLAFLLMFQKYEKTGKYYGYGNVAYEVQNVDSSLNRPKIEQSKNIFYVLLKKSNDILKGISVVSLKALNVTFNETKIDVMPSLYSRGRIDLHRYNEFMRETQRAEYEPVYEEVDFLTEDQDVMEVFNALYAVDQFVMRMDPKLDHTLLDRKGEHKFTWGTSHFPVDMDLVPSCDLKLPIFPLQMGLDNVTGGLDAVDFDERTMSNIKSNTVYSPIPDLTLFQRQEGMSTNNLPTSESEAKMEIEKRLGFIGADYNCTILRREVLKRAIQNLESCVNYRTNSPDKQTPLAKI